MQYWGPAAVPVARRPALGRGALISPLCIPASKLPLVVGILASLLPSCHWLWASLHPCFRAATGCGHPCIPAPVVSPDTLRSSYLLVLCFSLAACSPSAARAADPQGFINFSLHHSLGEVPHNYSTLITPLCTSREGVIHSPKV